MRQDDLNNWFSYHAPRPEQVEVYNALRNKAKEFAELFDASVPDCADKTAAMRDLRNTTMAMNLAIACYEFPTTQVEVVGSAMPPHQQRVLDEKKELDEKSSKLNTFFNTAIFGRLSGEEQDRLHRQYELMVQYSAMLDERIAAF